MTSRPAFLGLITLVVFMGCSAPENSPKSYLGWNSPAFTTSRSPLLEPPSRELRYLDAGKRVQYEQNFGGMGPGVGLLVGPIGLVTGNNGVGLALVPLGLVVNHAMVTHRTKRDATALQSLSDLDPVSLLREAGRDHGWVFTDAPGNSSNLSPYVRIVKMSGDGRLAIAAGLILESGIGDSRLAGRYLYQLAWTPSLDAIARSPESAPTELGALLREGYAAILERLRAETPESVAKEQPVTYRSTFMAPRARRAKKGWLIQEDADRVWIRTPKCIFASLKVHTTLRRN